MTIDITMAKIKKVLDSGNSTAFMLGRIYHGIYLSNKPGAAVIADAYSIYVRVRNASHPDRHSEVTLKEDELNLLREIYYGRLLGVSHDK